ncbi:ABC transporter ATP-binding protein [Rhodococcus rhodnii]|uniref:ABC transporter n=2 Tax=Rhodococcus rhodnii TaxID=38312 RepID=R7WNT5_9NOCA|nr:ABC transporter ATP-binding protein [Rhodococcus rhodnii]EOM76962.1 ABC transporter [Rhodococcus rhodnii LMG 5362]TXG89468.1 ABC transporter ATP-binding protein [Rhodococcus rhodnii]
MDAVTVDAVVKTLGSKRVLDGCSFSVGAGSITALMGLNGSGKSTLVKIPSGLERADAGTVKVAGMPVGFGVPPSVSYLAQSRPLHTTLRVGEILAYAADLNDEFDIGLAMDWVEDFGVSLGDRCKNLSGGQHTQVALAVAVGQRTDVVVLDEPLADLDPIAKERVCERIALMSAESGRTFLVSTHVLAYVSSICDRIVVLADGAVALDIGTTFPEGVRLDHAALEAKVLGALRSTRTSSAAGRERR